MEGSGRLGGYEHIAARWGREGADLGRVGEKLLRLVKYGNKKLSTYLSTTVDNSIKTFLILRYISI